MLNETAICHLKRLPMRAEPSHRSEMVSELLFGELYHISEANGGDWLRISSDYDGYEGWIDLRSPYILTANDVSLYKSRQSAVVTSPVLRAKNKNGHELMLNTGHILPFWDGQAFQIYGTHYYVTDGYLRTADTAQPAAAEFIIGQAYGYLGAPYVWGGRSFDGTDCSGLIQNVLRAGGYYIPRDAGDQIEYGESVGTLADGRPGDLAFFESDDRITHVGLLTGDGKIIHAYNSVRLDTIDEKGIVNKDVNKYTHTLHSVRRIIER